MNTVHSFLRRVRQVGANRFARNTVWMFVGQGSSVIFQAGYFVCLGRLLGSEEYGVYVGMSALALLLAQYSGLGSHSVFLRYVSPAPKQFRRYWGNALATTCIAGTLLAAILSLAGPHVSHSYSHTMVACVALGDCVFGQITVAAWRVFQAFERMRFTAALNLLTNGLRTVLAGTLLLVVHRTTAREWVWATLAVSAIGSATALVLVTNFFGKPEFSMKLLKARVAEGLVFALSYSTGGVLNDVDKAMLGHYGMNLANGIYSMAYRVVDVGMMPISAVHTAAFPRFFQKGLEGSGATRVFAQRILKRTAPTGLALAATMWVAAGLIPRVLGSSFAESTAALRWLSMLPLFRSFHLSAGDALTGAGKQKLRLMTQTVAAAFNVGANLWLIPRYGWLGAAWSSLITDAALAGMNWTALICASRKILENCRDREPLVATH